LEQQSIADSLNTSDCLILCTSLIFSRKRSTRWGDTKGWRVHIQGRRNSRAARVSKLNNAGCRAWKRTKRERSKSGGDVSNANKHGASPSWHLNRKLLTMYSIKCIRFYTVLDPLSRLKRIFKGPHILMQIRFSYLLQFIANSSFHKRQWHNKWKGHKFLNFSHEYFHILFS